jgi:L-asparaginase
VVFAGAIHHAHDVRKVHPYRLDAFASGDAGVVGYVEEGRLRLLRDWPAARTSTAQAAIEKIAAGAPWPRVEIVMSHAGAGRGVADALVAQGVDGLVAACTGNGSLHHELEAALRDAHAAGVKVVRATRCAEGAILAHGGDALPHAESLSPVKARIRMQLALLAAR